MFAVKNGPQIWEVNLESSYKLMFRKISRLNFSIGMPTLKRKLGFIYRKVMISQELLNQIQKLTTWKKEC